MTTKERIALLHQLIKALAQQGSWCGETHIQKAAYFVQNLANLSAYKFVLYKFGPFSFDLRDDLELMRAYGMIERLTDVPGYGPRLQLRNHPKTDEDAQKLIAPYQKVIHRVSKLLGGAGVPELERLATALYFTRQEPVRDHGDRVKRMRSIKPHIMEPEARDAIEQVDALFA
jgi:uncharacterized protein YwgA